MATYADISEPWLSGDSRIDALLLQWPHWQYETPSDSAIYYTFSTTEGNQSDGFFQPTDISSFSAAQEAAARQALADAAAVTGIQFVEVANGTLADIHFANGDLFQNAAGQMSGSSGGQGGAGRTLLSYDANAYIYLDSNEYAHLFTNPAPGTEGYQILLHELGHALGLKHPHEGEIRLAAAEDNTGNTVMSYNWSGAPKSDYQAYDVDALQWWYGPDGLGGVSYGGTQTMTLNGTTGADRLTGGGGSDTMNGSAGNDMLIGGGGNDVMDGGAGVDSMDGGLGGDIYYASTGDVLTDAGGFDVVFSDISWTLAAGFEELELLAANLVGTGNSADNVLWGGFGNSTLIGGAGDDDLYSRGSGTLQGGPGNDLMVSTMAGDNRFVFAEAPGAANSDVIFHFGNGADKIVLDPAAHPNLGASGQFTVGDARFFAGPGASSGQDTSDRVIYNTSTGELWYDADGSGAGPAQLIVRMEPIPALAATDIVVVGAATPGATITGTSGNDRLVGTAGDDTMNGLGGNDTFVGGSGGADVIDGGEGRDSIEFMTATSAVVADFVAGTMTGGGPGTISFTNIERVVTGDFNDQVTGNAAGQTLTGRAGSDTLWGAGGVDTLWGGGGADTFIFREMGTANADAIGDWTSGSDKLLLDGTVMSALGAAGNFAAGDARFAANSTGTAQDASDRIIYNTTTRQIFYDADGSGAGGAVLIATLQSGATLVATDIAVEGGSPPPPSGPTQGDDSLVGTSGNDTIDGLAGDDTINGLAGNDSLIGNEGADSLIGGDGNDTLNGEASLFGETDADIETLDGGLGNDTFIVDNAADVLLDAGGTDTIVAVNMNWTLGAGFENLILNNDEDEFRRDGIGNELDNVLGAPGGSGWFVYFEGRGGNDTIFGSPQDDTLLGGEGNDSINGEWDHDTIDGGAGNDTLFGGEGEHADFFTFTVAPGAANADTINDFAAGDGDFVEGDRIVLDGAVHASSGPSGFFAPGDARFWSSTSGTAHDADDRVIYNTSNGQLWYDADGTGAGLAQLIATLQGAPTLEAGDITIINGSGGSTINGTSGNDSLVGGPGDDTISGLAGNDTLVGNAGNDSLDGGDGFDSLDGGLGDDTFVGAGYDGFDQATDAASDAGGVDTAITIEGHFIQLNAGIENLVVPATHVPTGVTDEIDVDGNELNNFIRTELDALILVDGGQGNDTLLGGPGSEQFLFGGNYGDDSVDGGGGFDILSFYGDSAATADLGAGTASGSGTGTVRFTGIEGAAGTAHDDLFRAGNTDAEFAGDIGDDTLIGGAGDDVLYGGGFLAFPGDFESFETGSDQLSGGAGNDLLVAGGGADTLSGGLGNDTLDGEGEAGEPGANTFLFDVAPGASNADLIASSFTSGRDKLVLDGAVHANSGPSGSFSDDDARFWSSTSGTAHDADDRVIYNTSNGQLWYDADGNAAGAAQLIATLQGMPSLAATDVEVINGSAPPPPPPSGQTINGTAGADRLSGGPGNDTINGLGGNDTFVGGSGGADVIDGGDGRDSIEFMTATSAVVVDFGGGTITGGGPGTTSFTNIERMVSGDFNDQLTGNAAGQTLTARAGSDTLWGAGGVDTLWSGTGADTFIFRETGTSNADVIGDWASGSDKVALDDAAMSALGATGNFSAGDARFAAGAGFTSGRDASDRVVFDTSTGSLYYDADGSGSAAAQLIATVQSGAAIAATDIVVI